MNLYPRIPQIHTNCRQKDAALFTVVDTPGADAVGSVREQKKDLARLASADADFLVLVFDAVQGFKRPSRNGRPIAPPRDDGMSNIANKL